MTQSFKTSSYPNPSSFQYPDMLWLKKSTLRTQQFFTLRPVELTICNALSYFSLVAVSNL